MKTIPTSDENNDLKTLRAESSELTAIEMRDCAIEYAGKGWKVMPLHTPDAVGQCSCNKSDCKSVGKHPRTINGLKDATANEDKIRQWWGIWPNANIGIVTGNGSGVVVLDVDLKTYGHQSLAYLENEYGTLPQTLESITGSGGSHYLFACPDVPVKNSASRIAHGLDIRAEGGYIVAPPSFHKSGQRYQWKTDCEIAPMPDWLLQLATQPKQSIETKTDEVEVLRSNAGEFVNGECIPEGQRNDTLFRLACSERSRNLDEPEILALLLAVNKHRCDPPLLESEIKTITASSSSYAPETNFIHSNEAKGSAASQREKLGLTWGEFAKQSFPDSEKILSELERGELGMLVAASNVGKTTLAMNLALLGAVGRSFPPLIKRDGMTLRTMYVDGETRQAKVQRDIQCMMRGWGGEMKALVEDNLHIVCDESLDGLPLNLSREWHLEKLAGTASEFRPDLIVLDTLASLFTMSAENDNAEMTNRVMKPLAKFAKDTNAAVMLLHHVGKQSEDSQARNTAYRARGASASGASARMVLLLSAHPSDRQSVILHCAKVKGTRFEDLVLRLDNDTRWLIPTNEAPPHTVSSYEKVVNVVKAAGRVIQRKDIDEALPTMSQATITRHLKEAQRRKVLVKPKTGHYCTRELNQMLGTIDTEQMTNHKEVVNSQVVN